MTKVLSTIGDTVLDETSTTQQLREALDEFTQLCSNISGVVPDAGFDAWAEDTFLDGGVAINPQAAAHCVRDYLRTVIFIRGVYAAITSAQARFPKTPIQILYAGCGPYATLLLPLIGKFKPGELSVFLLDIHQSSLDSADLLISHFGLDAHHVKTLLGDACSYRHPGPLQLIIAETMQKSLEQEPQFSVTANLAPQLCSQGIFIPEKIEVEMCMAHLAEELEIFKRSGEVKHELMVKNGRRHTLATVLTLTADNAAAQIESATYNKSSSRHELAPTIIIIPSMENLQRYDVLLLTRIQVFKSYQLREYEAEITLPQNCNELSPLEKGASYAVSYHLGSYPKLNLTRIGP